MAKVRDPLQVSPQFKKRLSDLQIRLMKKIGTKVSYTDITEQMSRSVNLENLFDEIENKLLNKGEINIRIKFDRRII